jgi:hypothetical protein
MQELNVFLQEYDLLEESVQGTEQDFSWFCFDSKTSCPLLHLSLGLTTDVARQGRGGPDQIC